MREDDIGPSQAFQKSGEIRKYKSYMSLGSTPGYLNRQREERAQVSRRRGSRSKENHFKEIKLILGNEDHRMNGSVQVAGFDFYGSWGI